jgi:hypothetical protein
MGSQRGEYIGAGAEWRYAHANARFAADYGRDGPDPSTISITIDQTADGHGPWDVELGAPRGRTLTAGRYLDALENHLRPPGLPGIRVAGDGRACGRVNGRFVVREARFAAAGVVSEASADRGRLHLVPQRPRGLHRTGAGRAVLESGERPLSGRARDIGKHLRQIVRVRRIRLERRPRRAGPAATSPRGLRGSDATPLRATRRAWPRRRRERARLQHVVRPVCRPRREVWSASPGPEFPDQVRAALRGRRSRAAW